MLLSDSDIAQILTPLGQFGIAVRGGIDFTTHSARIQGPVSTVGKEKYRTVWSTSPRRAATVRLLQSSGETIVKSDGKILKVTTPRAKAWSAVARPQTVIETTKPARVPILSNIFPETDWPTAYPYGYCAAKPLLSCGTGQIGRPKTGSHSGSNDVFSEPEHVGKPDRSAGGKTVRDDRRRRAERRSGFPAYRQHRKAYRSLVYCR